MAVHGQEEAAKWQLAMRQRRPAGTITAAMHTDSPRRITMDLGNALLSA
jgi:hypothetical protein